MFARLKYWVCLAAILLGLVALFLPAPQPARAETEDTNEKEPNNTIKTAQLIETGLLSPTHAMIAPAGDVDWFRFSAAAGRTYVIELYNTAATLEGDSPGSNCDGTEQYGVGMRLFMSLTQTTPMLSQCAPVGSGLAHNQFAFTAPVTGVYFLQIIPNHKLVTGAYHLRILPKHDEPGAGYDWIAAEPNNVQWNAFPIHEGYTGTITSQFEELPGFYATARADMDWYYINAIAGRTYVVELLEVKYNREGDYSGYLCDEQHHDGIGLKIFEPYRTVPVAVECHSGGAGNVHNMVTFTAGTTGPYYIQLLPNSQWVEGQYRIRVLPKYGEPDALWNLTPGIWPGLFEPDNSYLNAYTIMDGAANAQKRIIEHRDGSMATFTADQDWFRFEGVKGEAYYFYITNADPQFADAGTACDPSQTLDGIAMTVYFEKDNLPIVQQCVPQRNGWDNMIGFIAEKSGMYYLKVFPNANTAWGEYTISMVKYTELKKFYLPYTIRNIGYIPAN
jgi:hypothetical protein